MKTLEDEWYVLRDFFCIVIYCVSVLSLHIESTDSMIGHSDDICTLHWMCPGFARAFLDRS